ncbi:zinc-ribbon domain-containing protein [Sphingomicrobium flavum]|uniref:zinc-ribbon domain-containing protein n=1 Tax=Sphingomicrobium flavum TaxID=1229164 RepID=UPI0021AD9D5A|nr:zinc-ribbon domain-containing protein [Sphingomicrobium flavum]
MILTCPSCSTRYVVKDGAIPPGGRKVRCASCKHSWHQDPDELTQAEAEAPLVDDAAMPPADEPVPEAEAGDVSAASYDADEPAAPVSEPVDDMPDEDDALADATMPGTYRASFSITPPALPEAEEDIPPPPETPDVEPVDDSWPVADEQADLPQPSFSTDPVDEPAPIVQPEAEAEADVHETQDFGFVTEHYEEEEEPKKRGGLILMGLLLLVGAAAAAFYFLAPDSLKQQVGLVKAQTETPLQMLLDPHTREALPSGNELLTVSGRVINPTDATQEVPMLHAYVRDSAGQIVHQWTIQPPRATLGPGESATFNNVQTDMPPGGNELSVTFEEQAD